ncbi:MAG: FecR domain-containing protein [Prolixibacteraceae bacterium]|nr:FecR domain-containing protein [Prolixibacteraceae bacterium]
MKWIFQNNPSTEQFWKNYLLEHPEEKIQIQELKQRLLELQFSNDTLSYTEKAELGNLIVNRLDRDLKRTKRSLVLRSLMKYAAVAIVFAAIGGLVVYLNTGKDTYYQQFAEQIIRVPASGSGPVLITSNGQNVDLKKSNSNIDYSQNGTIVLNNDSVIPALKDEPNVMNQLIIPYGNQSRLVLSDNTVVWLNAGSRLVYPSRFEDKTREVLLFGEAFFEVSKDEKKPFIVKTSDLQIKVLGTQFNISAYTEDKVIQTVLKEGSVSISNNNSGLFERDLVLKPNQMASFNRTSKDTKVYEVDVNYYTLWTKGLLSFDEIDFTRIVKKVERFYNISIEFSEPLLGATRISGKLDLKQKREEVLEYLEKVSLTTIEKVNDNQYMVKK